MAIKKWSAGTRISNNDFKGDVVFYEGLSFSIPCLFGPSNTVNGVLLLRFGNNSYIKSFNNLLTRVEHHYYGDRTYNTANDTYSDSEPFSFFNNNPANPAEIVVNSALIDGVAYSGHLSPALGQLGVSDLEPD